MYERKFLKFWRYRITRIRVYPLDEEYNVIKNPNSFQRGYYFGIRLPVLFTDLDSFHHPHTFTAPSFYCMSHFKNDGRITEDIGDQCDVQAGRDIQPTPDGTFRFDFENHFNLPVLEKVKAVKIEIAGHRNSLYRRRK